MPETRESRGGRHHACWVRKIVLTSWQAEAVWGLGRFCKRKEDQTYPNRMEIQSNPMSSRKVILDSGTSRIANNICKPATDHSLSSLSSTCPETSFYSSSKSARNMNRGEDGKILRWSPFLRLLLLPPALISPALCLHGLITGHSVTPWMGSISIELSAICAALVCFSDPRSKNKIVHVLESLLLRMWGVTQILFAMKTGVDGFMFNGVAIVVIMEPRFLSILYSGLSDSKLHTLLTKGLFQRSATFLTSSLYITFSAVRCLADLPERASDEDVIEMCGNPIYPTWALTSYIALCFVMSVLLPPLMESGDLDVLTIPNLIAMDIPLKLGLEIFMFFIVSLAGLLNFSILSEDGAPGGEGTLAYYSNQIFIYPFTAFVIFEGFDKILYKLYKKLRTKPNENVSENQNGNDEEIDNEMSSEVSVSRRSGGGMSFALNQLSAHSLDV